MKRTIKIILEVDTKFDSSLDTLEELLKTEVYYSDVIWTTHGDIDILEKHIESFETEKHTH